MSFEVILQTWSITVLVIVAGVFVGIVWALIREIRKSVTASCSLVEEIKQVRKLESMPYVQVDIKPKETQIQVLEVVIRNIGKGSAFNFNCKFTPDILYREKPKVTISDLPIFKNLKFFLQKKK